MRLAVFGAFLLALFYLLAVRHVVDVEEVRRTVSATGPAAPLTYVVVSAVLGAVFVPGPILAASSGLLFGPVQGIFVTLGATVGTAVVASLVGRRAGRESARALLGTKRADRIDALIERRGLWAVVGVGLRGDRGVVRDRHRRRVRRAARISKVAWASWPRRA